MTKYCIVLCGGGGKTTLCKKYPDKFLDIDDFMFQDIGRREKLMKCIASEEVDIKTLGNIYEYEMKNNEQLRNDERIILVHRQSNATLLSRKVLLIAKPTRELHEKNISNREDKFKKLSRNDWLDITGDKVFVYENFEELYSKIFL
jgi:hypothetical protein